MVNVEAKLAETNEAIAIFEAAGTPVPPEAVEVQEIMRRCVDAERMIATTAETELAIGREAYEAYARHTNFKSLVSGAPLPQWDGLSDAIRQAWNVSAAWVAGRVLRKAGVMK